MQTNTVVRPDARNRVCLGSFAKDVSGFTISCDGNGVITLEPLYEMPAREKWLYQNKQALESVKKGLKEASESKLVDRGDFTQYLNKEDEI